MSIFCIHPDCVAMLYEPSAELFIHWSLPCYIVRNATKGTYNAYVAIPDLHPLYGSLIWDLTITALDVHGKITWTGNYAPGISREVYPGTWWIGFDCGHTDYDLSPVQLIFNYKEPDFDDQNKSYKSVEYVRTEVKKLAEQLAAMLLQTNNTD